MEMETRITFRNTIRRLSKKMYGLKYIKAKKAQVKMELALAAIVRQIEEWSRDKLCAELTEMEEQYEQRLSLSQESYQAAFLKEKQLLVDTFEERLRKAQRETANELGEMWEESRIKMEEEANVGE